MLLEALDEAPDVLDAPTYTKPHTLEPSSLDNDPLVDELLGDMLTRIDDDVV